MSFSSKRFGEVIITSVIVFILFVIGIVYITKNIADLTSSSNKTLITSNKPKINISKIIADIKEENKDLNLIYESPSLKEITSLIYEDDGKYSNIVIDNKTGEKLTFQDLIKETLSFNSKESELLALKYPRFIVDDIKNNQNNQGTKIYCFKENELIIYYYNYILSYDYNTELSLKINYQEIKDNLKFTPVLDSIYENEDGFKNNNMTKYVALTFDDGPSSKYNPLILDILEENKARATFFMVGSMMASCEDCVLKTYQSGNEIGSHSYEHMNIKNNSISKVQESLTKTNNIYHSITNDTIKLLRPPYGSYNSTNLNNISNPFILWNLDTEDWRYRNVDHIVNYIKDNISDGSIILMHELYETSYESLKTILPWLYINGYKVVTVSELAQIKGISLTSGRAYRNF